MAGYGSRFTRSGYKTYKPFLKISDKHNSIQKICKNFPTSTRKYFIVRNNLEKKYIKNLKNISNSQIIKIKPHNLGPGETLLRGFKENKELKKLNKIFVSYCDIDWKWDFKKIKTNQNYIYCFTGWHPHTKDNNNYAFCKVSEKKKLIKLKEKKSFTKNWQYEPLSIGLFFYLKGEQLLRVLQKMKKRKITTNNEFFPSESFNLIKNVMIDHVDSFVHIGKPNYLEEYKNWYFFFKRQKKFQYEVQKQKSLFDEIIIPAGGKSQRFKKEKIYIPKYLYFIKSLNLRCIDYINFFLPNKKKNLITIKDKFSKYINKKNFNILYLHKRTAGQALTVNTFLERIQDNKSFFVNSCDVFSLYNIKKLKIFKSSADIIVFVSKKSFQDLNANNYTWIEKERNKLKNIYIKKKPKIENLKILTGNFYFKNKKIFQNCLNYSLKNLKGKEVYVDNLIKAGVKLKYKIKVIEDENYINLGTPSLIKDFVFWREYFRNDK